MRAALLAVLLFTSPLAAEMTTFTANGLTGGTLAPGPWVLACDCASGSRVSFTIEADPNRNGLGDPVEAVLWHVVVKDGGPTDEEGTAGRVRFTIQPSTVLSGPVTFCATESEGEIRIAFEITPPAQGQAVSGIVYDRYGAPLPGVLVTAQAGDGRRFLTVTGAGGAYTLGVPVGVVTVRADAAGQGAYHSFPWWYQLLVTAGGSRPGCSFLAMPTGSSHVTGRVQDDAGRAVPGCWVAARGGSTSEGCTTDDGGYFNLWLRSGAYTLQAMPPSGWAGVSQALTVPPDQTGLVLTVPQASGSIAGRVRAGSTGLGGAAVVTQGTGGSYATISNASGWYQCWLPAGTYTVSARLEGYSQRHADEWTGTPNTTAADMALTANGSHLSGRMTAPGGGSAPGLLAVSDLGGTWSGWWEQRPAATDAAGAYTLALPAGQWQVQPAPFSGAVAATQTVTVPPDGALNFATAGAGANPSLGSGVVNPASGLPTDAYTYHVAYVDPMGRLPGPVVVLVDGKPQLMAADDTGDTDPTDGITYSYTQHGLAQGAHVFRFVTGLPGALSPVTTDQAGPTVVALRLDQPGISPPAGDTLTHFTVSVRYTQAGNVAPVTRQLQYRVNGGTWVTVDMATLASDYRTGAWFTWTGSLPAGQVEYRLKFSDGVTALTLPASGAYPGPNVAAVSLADATCVPGVGSPTTTFTLGATWRHSGGTAPPPGLRMLWRPVGGGSFASCPLAAGSGDPATGVVCTTTVSGLAAGSYEHYFSYQGADADELRLPAAGLLEGPVVAAGVPGISLSPGQGTFGGVVHFVAGADDPDGIDRVEFAVDGALSAIDTAAPYTFDWDSRPVSIPDGRHVVRATAWDGAGQAAWVEAVITADNATFDDVPKSADQWRYVEALARERITSGCQQAPPLYCPSSPVTRGQMAVFLCRAAGWAPYANPTPSFADVPAASGQYAYIEELYRRQVTAGCGGSPLRYCPSQPVTRGQMAVFLCRAAGLSLDSNPTPHFADVPAANPQFRYIETIYREGITAGCGGVPLNFCPDHAVTRGQMAVFLCRAFGISTGL